MAIVFSQPSYLWFFISIPILIAIHFLSIKYSAKKGLKFANFPAIEKATGNRLTSTNINVLLTRIAIVSLAILAAAGSTLWYTTVSSKADFILAIDSSSSMLANDYSPNRLESAKQAASLFVELLPGNSNIGVISFSGTSFIESQITKDKDRILESIAGITAKNIGGTDIGEAIITSSNLLSHTSEPKVVILLTDGRSNVGQIVDQAIVYANGNQVTVNTIGIGTTEGGSIYGGIGEDVTLTLDEATLQRISLETSGEYIRARDNLELVDAYRSMAELTNKKVSINLSVIFLIIVIILLFVEWSLINTKYKILP